MLMEIAAANAIWKTLSTALKNGQELYQLGTQLNDYLSATQKVKDKAGDANSKGTALECFQYSEQQRIQREQLEFHLKKSRLNGWSDFVKFEAQWHRQRREEAQEKINERIRRNAKLQKDIELGINVGICMILAMGLLFGIAVYIKG
jgi:predicted transposase YbfD/YdcC